MNIAQDSMHGQPLKSILSSSKYVTKLRCQVICQQYDLLQEEQSALHPAATLVAARQTLGHVLGFCWKSAAILDIIC